MSPKLPKWTRDDIQVTQSLDGVYSIYIGNVDKRYSTTFKASPVVAIKALVELVMSHELGVTEHDFLMKYDDFISEG